MKIREFFRSAVPILIFISMSTIWAQAEMGRGVETKGPAFHDDIVALAVPDDFSMNRLNVYVEVAYDELQFVKLEDGYQASYEISVVIFDQDGEQENGKIWKQTVSVQDYDQTNKQGIFDLSDEQFDLKPATYDVIVTLQDLETTFASKHKHTVHLRDFSKRNLALSSITFAKVTEDSLGVKSIRPEVTDPLKGLGQEIFAYFEIYHSHSGDQATLEYRISGERTKTRIEETHNITLAEGRTIDYFKIPSDSLEHDSYKLAITVTNGIEKATTEKPFYIRWSGIPASSEDLETAIEQIKYIATKSEWDKIRKASDNKKLEEFKRFWQRHDPTPGTEANEAMEAHYARVEYANENFSATQQKGWRTDMGMVYILLGAPDDVERNPFPRGSNPYEIWQYYRFNRSFVFVDYTGFGDFHLSTPFSIYEYQRLLK